MNRASANNNQPVIFVAVFSVVACVLRNLHSTVAADSNSIALSPPNAASATPCARTAPNIATAISMDIHTIVSHCTRLIAAVGAETACVMSAMRHRMTGHRLIHHLQHLRSASSHETSQQHRCEDKKNNVENCCVVPLDRGLDNFGVSLCWHKSHSLEDQLNDKCCGCHRSVHGSEQKYADTQAVIFSVNVQDRQHDQIGVDERQYAAEAAAAIPQHGG